MKKSFWLSIIVLILIYLAFDFGDSVANEALEIRLPILARREITELKEGRFFDNEEVQKIYLSNLQMNTILNNIKENPNWKKTKLDEKVDEKIKYYTREDIYYQIPTVENAYWIFTNRSHGVPDKHNIEEVSHYYAVSLGILDLDNNILYYYEYDR